MWQAYCWVKNQYSGISFLENYFTKITRRRFFLFRFICVLLWIGSNGVLTFPHRQKKEELTLFKGVSYRTIVSNLVDLFLLSPCIEQIYGLFNVLRVLLCHTTCHCLLQNVEYLMNKTTNIKSSKYRQKRGLFFLFPKFSCI